MSERAEQHPSDPVYFDTSALAKWYVAEVGSDRVEAYLQLHGPVAISSLTRVEMRSLLGRRRRERAIDAAIEMRAFATFEDDIRAGHLVLHPVSETIYEGAVHMLSILPRHPLRTLDALHLAVAREIRAPTLATADEVMARAAKALGFDVVRFG